MCQKLPIGSFKWKKNIDEFNEDFIKNYDEDCHKGYILEVDIEHPKNFLNLHDDLAFLAERKEIKKFNNVFVI